MKKRVTVQKEEIRHALEMLSPSHPTAAMVYEKVKEKIPKISLGTVYRNLKEMAGSHEILQLDVEGEERSRYCVNTHSHEHFKCLSCGELMDIHLPPTFDVDQAGRLLSEHKIYFHRLIFYGLCKKCLKR